MPRKPVKKQVRETVTQARIIEAAVQLFAKNGFKATSTRDISKLASVNEVTLFRHFPRKSDLFVAATESRLGRVRMGRALQSKLAEDAAIDEIVPMLTEFLVENFFSPPDIARLLYVAGFEVPGSEVTVREYLGPFFDSIHGYFERRAARGLNGDIEPAIATLSLAGIVSAHQYFYPLFTGRELDRSPEGSGPAYVAFVLNALCRP